MNLHSSITSRALVALSAALLPACAGTPDGSPEDAPAADEGALATTQGLSGVVAVAIGMADSDAETYWRTVGAPKKVESIVSSVRKLRSNERLPVCDEPSPTKLRFFDGAGKAMATAKGNCKGFGVIEFADGRAGYSIEWNHRDVKRASEADLAVGDLLWGVTSNAVSNDRAEKKTIRGDAMKPILDAFDRDETFGPEINGGPRCNTSASADFMRGSRVVAEIAFDCATLDRTSVKASMWAERDESVSVERGSIHLDPRLIVRVLPD